MLKNPLPTHLKLSEISEKQWRRFEKWRRIRLILAFIILIAIITGSYLVSRSLTFVHKPVSQNIIWAALTFISIWLTTLIEDGLRYRSLMREKDTPKIIADNFNLILQRNNTEMEAGLKDQPDSKLF